MIKIAGMPFLFAGECCIDHALRSGVRFNLTRLQDERVIYSFIVEGQVRYIGVCENSNTTLRSRMMRYQSMSGAGTNKRIVGFIRKELEAGREVRIAAWKSNEELQWHALLVDLVKGLENPLIRILKPDWNIKG